MLLRDHKELSPWPNLDSLGAAGSLLPAAFEVLRLKIQNIRAANPTGLHIVLSWGAGNCLCTKVFEDTGFAFAFYANRWQLIGKTLQEAGDVDIKSKPFIKARLTLQSTDKVTALAVLQNAFDRCRKEDIRTPEVLAALNFLELNSTVTWPFAQFREVMKYRGSKDWEVEGRWQVLHASMNAIRRMVHVNQQ